MKTFLAVFTGTPGSMAKWGGLTEKERIEREASGIAAWHAWAEKNKKSILQMGSPLGSTKNVSASGISDIRNNLTGYTVVQAETHDAAAKLFENHPHFTIFPGDGVEVMECMPIPSAYEQQEA
jgi:hypothetical protein